MQKIYHLVISASGRPISAHATNKDDIPPSEYDEHTPDAVPVAV